ncbi:SGNH/GDSL hydrolase family protein [Luteitalea sp.]
MTPRDRALPLMLTALTVLAALQLGAQAGHRLPGLAGDAVETMANRDLNKEAREALTAGYYEGLINEGARLGGMNRLVADSRTFTVEDRSQPDRRQVNAFHFYELVPGLEVDDYADDRKRYRLKVNSAGLADVEYPMTKPAGTRRIALFGDSITRGQGAPFQENYEALLEARLNAARPSPEAGRVEILNFAVGSYSVMQMMDRALERAPAFEPDVYVVALTDLSVYRSWAHHLALLLQAGVDLKYDYLKTLIREAGVTTSDTRGVFDAKMARHRIPTITWALQMIRDHARRQNAEMVVFFVPTADDPAVLEEEFLGVRQMVQSLGIPIVDGLDTFAAMPDRGGIRVSSTDRHPNRDGHRMLADRLWERLRSTPAAWTAIAGEPAGTH